jgi:nucleoid-associated protein YgaU
VALLVGIEQERRAAKVARLVAAAPWAAAGSSASSTGEPLEYAEADWRSNAVAVGAAFVGRYTQVPREDVTGALAMVGTQHSLVTFAPNAEASADAEGTGGGSAAAEGSAKPSSIGTVAITVVLNPLTEAAQRVAPLLLVLRDQLRLPLQLLLLPELTTTSFPLSKFYRFVASADLGDVAPGAVFADLPKKHVLTMRLGTRQ